MYRKARFVIETSKVFDGYHIKGRHWNGWERPLFTKEVCDEILKEFCVENIAWQEGKYVETTEDNEQYDIDPVQITIDNEKLTVYEIGNGWIWDEYEEADEE